MKKIINGKVYDTKTANEVGFYANAADRRDFSQFEETLYKKRTGEFFLYGEGGPMTKYAVSHGQNSWSGGAKIIPLGYEAAREWAERHLDTDEYEAIFGEVADDESRTQLCLSVSTRAAETMRRKAQEAGMTVSAYVESLL